MGEFKELNRIEKVREFRIATRSSLKAAIEAVEAGWNPGDPIDHDLTARMDEEYAKQARIRNAAPALLEALQDVQAKSAALVGAVLSGDQREMLIAANAVNDGYPKRYALIASALGEG